MKCPNSRYRNSQNDDIVHHVHDSKNKEEQLHFDAFALSAQILIPEMTDGSTGERHGDPEDERVYGRQKGRYPEHYCVQSVFVDAEGEEAAVEEEDADFDGCDGESVYEGFGVDNLRFVSMELREL